LNGAVGEPVPVVSLPRALSTNQSPVEAVQSS
jgi:hypothetical protein